MLHCRLCTQIWEQQVPLVKKIQAKNLTYFFQTESYGILQVGPAKKTFFKTNFHIVHPGHQFVVVVHPLNFGPK